MLISFLPALPACHAFFGSRNCQSPLISRLIDRDGGKAPVSNPTKSNELDVDNGLFLLPHYSLYYGVCLSLIAFKNVECLAPLFLSRVSFDAI